jgi:dipeptidyl aminopeptidase/acylaminoacyl peptidase/uncharacterized protein (DUF885 family)
MVVAAVAGTLAQALPAAHAGQVTKADYARADGLRERMTGKVFRDRVEPHWLAGDERFWYRVDLPDGAREFILVDAARRTRQPAFDHVKLADALTLATGKAQRPTHLMIDRLAFPREGTLVFEAAGKTWRFENGAGPLKPGEASELAPTERRTESRRREAARPFQGSARRTESPDGQWVTFVKDHNLFIREKATGKEFPLSEGGTEKDGYEPAVYWSPDSKKLVAIRTARSQEHKVYLIESSPAGQLQPKLHSFDYLKPGDQVPVHKPHLFDVASRKEIPVRDTLFANPYETGEFRWAPDSSLFTFLFNQRGHQVLRLVGIDPKTGDTRAVIDEQSPTFVDYSGKFYLQHIDKTNEIIWMSERDGWNHLYLIDAATGKVKNPITKGEWVVRGVDRVDEDARQIWFRAGGIRPGQDPYYVHYARVNFDGSGLVVLTEGDGTHRAAFSPDRKYFVDTYSRVDMPPVVELRSAHDGALVCELERADWSALLSAGWQVPERFVAKARDGKTDIYGVIWRPTNFDPRAKYPVIETIYAGPQGSFVPKAFSPVARAQALAELGFVLVQMDGMGTSNRSKAFHDVCWKNLGDAGFPDRILWMKAAAAKYPYLDISRVGVYGGSAGGQNALGALLTHPEFYKAGVADCGCHDNRMDKIWWNELWMSWPIGDHYAAQSNVTLAHKLQGKLLLTVGELDRNVDPASTMQVVNALIKAGKDFELIVFPGGGHGAGSGRYGERRMRDFFVRHLLKADPPDWNSPETTSPVAETPATPPARTGDSQVIKTSAAAKATTAERAKRTEPAELGDLDPAPSELRDVIERFSADARATVRSPRFGRGDASPAQRARQHALAEHWLDLLKKRDFDTLSQAGRIDYLLLKHSLQHQLRTMDAEAKADAEAAPLIPFAATIYGLEDARQAMKDLDPRVAANTLDELNKTILATRKAVEAGQKENAKPGATAVSKIAAYRASRTAERLRGTLRDWSDFYNGYDPLYTWWAAEPYKALDRTLHDYGVYLSESLAGVKRGDESALVGEPIGRDALRAELDAAMIPYSPEELIDIANREFAWCRAELKRAAHDMGYGDDWKKALEKVKNLHVEPGKQPALIRDLAREAIQFVDEHDLVTVPALARESWHMEMMTPQRQLVNPFFTGGEVISVSYPTSTMSHEQKLMSMRGNNIHFSRATVHHELIPGHHLQGFMAARHKAYRRMFSTPFLVEGWPLYWETLLWDMKFPKSPEDRVGMLFWRSHRAARIIFSLSFHLGKMTPQECVDFLVDQVGHERENAAAEVRRSFNGSYEPLYQCAYLLGGLQIRALRKELVDSGKMTNRAFHDAILRENAIPIEMIRASLTGQELARDFSTRWRFYDLAPPK